MDSTKNQEKEWDIEGRITRKPRLQCLKEAHFNFPKDFSMPPIKFTNSSKGTMFSKICDSLPNQNSSLNKQKVQKQTILFLLLGLFY